MSAVLEGLDGRLDRSWSSGEPFDHSSGKERCGLLNVNSRTLDDVDCELGGTPTRFYRFVCERTMEQHLKVRHNQLCLRISSKNTRESRFNQVLKP